MIEASGRKHSQIYRLRECAVRPFIARRKPKNVGGTVVPSRTLLIHSAFATPVPGAPPGMEIEVTGTLVEVSAAITAARTRKELMKALLVERARVETARALAAPSIAGPIVVALLFAVAAGAMLPGAETFAASHFQLNTALLLFLGYGWMFLLLWAVLGLSLLATRSTFDARNLVPAAK